MAQRGLPFAGWRTAWPLALVVTVWIIVAAVISLASLQAASITSWSDGNRLAEAANFALATANDLHARGKSMPEIAKAIVAGLGSRPGISMSVVDDSGHLLAGRPITPEPVTIRLFDMGVPVQTVQNIHYHFMTGGGAPQGFAQAPPPMMMMPVPPPDAVKTTTDHPPLPFAGRLAAALSIHGGTIFLSVTESSLRKLEQHYAIGMALVLLFAVLSTWLVHRGALTGVLRPVTSVAAALRAFGRGEYSRLEVVSGSDATSGGIVAAYNDAAEQMATAVRGRIETESNMRQFVAEAGHELRTPLTVILGYVDVLRQGAIAEVNLAQRILTSIIAEGQRMSGLITKLLMLARLDTLSEATAETVDVGDLAMEVVDSIRPIANGTVIVARVAPESRVRAARAELREAVSNLLDNAVKYGRGAPIEVDVSRDGAEVVLSVKDSGPGMSADTKQRAFERFSRGDERGDVPGSGLGLAIVKRAAQRAGGSVSLESAPGKGATVVVRLPQAKADGG